MDGTGKRILASEAEYKIMMNRAHQTSGETENNLMNDLFRAKTQNI